MRPVLFNLYVQPQSIGLYPVVVLLRKKRLKGNSNSFRNALHFTVVKSRAEGDSCARERIINLESLHGELLNYT